MKTPVHHQKLVFLDVETTGTRPDFHEIIEIAIVPQDDDDDPFCTKIRPLHPDRVSDEAIACNGYNPEEWKGAPKIMEVYAEIATRLHDRVVCGHHVGFDLSFTKSWCGESSFQCRSIDTVTLAYAHLIPMGLSSLRLREIASFLGIKSTRSHRALDDALTCRAVYREILRRVRERPTKITKRQIEGLGRDRLIQIIEDLDLALTERLKGQ